MNRIALALSTAALFVCGCNQDQAPTKPEPTPAKVESAKPEPVKPAVVAKAPKLYFEVTKDGKTYVTDKAATASGINQGQMPEKCVPATGPNGEAIMISSDSPETVAGLTAEYAKQHPKK